MKLSIAMLLVGSATATSIRATSKAGSKLLSNARRLNDDGDMTWVANYSLKFEKCATTSDYYGGQFDGNNNNNNNNNNYQQQQEQQWQGGMYERKVVHFKLCPTDTCGSGCSGGADYVVDMDEFVGSYLEYKMELQEQECETAKENSGCENYDDEEGCLYTYFTKMNLSQCIEQDGENANGQQEEEFDLQQAAECGRLDVDEEAAQYYAYQNGQSYNQYNNQNQQNVEFFVGPTCSSNGKSINLAVFMDETCSYSAPDGVYEKFHYGKKLPYSSSSIVEHDCISCLEPAEEEDENNNQDGNNNYNYNNNQDDAQPEVLEVCERLYEPAGKCETNLQIYGMYPNTMACEFISGLNHWSLAGVTSSLKSAKKNVTPSVLAGVFAATTVVFAAVAYNLNKKVRRQAVGLMPYDEAQHVPY